MCFQWNDIIQSPRHPCEPRRLIRYLRATVTELIHGEKLEGKIEIKTLEKWKKKQENKGQESDEALEVEGAASAHARHIRIHP